MNASNQFFVNNPWMIIIVMVFIVWTVFWKGYALWTAVKNDHKKWFIALVVINNTLGILEIFYIFYIANKKWTDVRRVFNKTWSSIK